MATLRERIPIGSHRVLWLPEGSEDPPIDLGFTKDGCMLEKKTEVFNVKVPEITVPIKTVKTSVDLRGKLTLIELPIDTLAIALDMVKTTVVGTPNKVSLDENPLAGEEIPMGKLIFRPRSAGTSELQDKIMWAAGLICQAGMAFKVNENLTVDIELVAHADEDPDNLGNYRVFTMFDALTEKYFEL